MSLRRRGWRARLTAYALTISLAGPVAILLAALGLGSRPLADAHRDEDGVAERESDDDAHGHDADHHPDSDHGVDIGVQDHDCVGVDDEREIALALRTEISSNPRRSGPANRSRLADWSAITRRQIQPTDRHRAILLAAWARLVAAGHVTPVGGEALAWPPVDGSRRACQATAPIVASAYIATAAASPARTSEA